MTLNEEIKELKNQIKALVQKIRDLSINTEEKTVAPHSKVGGSRIMSNRDLVFDGNEKIWKTYAVYKDDEEEEE